MKSGKLKVSEVHYPFGLEKFSIVKFSDGKQYEACVNDTGNGWDCVLRLPSGKNVTSRLRRKLVLDHLGLAPSIERLEKTRVDNMRRSLRKYGYKLSKSHASKYPHAANRGGYMVTNGNQVVLGPWYDATLEHVEELLAEKAAEFRVDG